MAPKRRRWAERSCLRMKSGIKKAVFHIIAVTGTRSSVSLSRLATDKEGLGDAHDRKIQGPGRIAFTGQTWKSYCKCPAPAPRLTLLIPPPHLTSPAESRKFPQSVFNSCWSYGSDYKRYDLWLNFKSDEPDSAVQDSPGPQTFWMRSLTHLASRQTILFERVRWPEIPCVCMLQ